MSRHIPVVEKYQMVGAVYAIERNGRITPVLINGCSDDELMALSKAARDRFEAGGDPGDAVEAGQLRRIVTDRKQAREKGEQFMLTTMFVEAAD
jgi:hypothetical protein